MVWPILTTFLTTLTSGSSQPGQTPVWAEVVVQFGSFVTQALMAPIMTIALTLVYYDERVRKEAFDLKHMMQQLDAAIARPPHPA